MTWVLLLNQSYDPLHFINKRRAIKLLCKDRAEVYTSFSTGIQSVWSGSYFATSSEKIQMPATIRLKNQVNKRWKPPKFHRRALFNRDGWICQYCSAPLERKTVTIDHVLPRAQGGKTSWLNCVTACVPCNKKKANQTPSQAGMQLLKAAAVPTQIHFWDSNSKVTWHDDWSHFFKNH